MPKMTKPSFFSVKGLRKAKKTFKMYAM